MIWNYIKERMLKHPNSKLIENDTQFTYYEIIERVESLAADLNSPCYAVLCRHSINTAIGILACFASGETAIPLSHRYGRIHCERIINTITPGYIISDCVDFSNDNADAETENISLSITELNQKHYIPQDPHPALIMCTSGTTGTPKGAMIGEEGLICNLEDIEEYFKIDVDDKIMILRPLYHCAVLTGEFLISLLRGLDIHFYNEEFNPHNIIQYANENKISVICGTPTLLATIAKFNIRIKNRFTPRVIAVSGECMTINIAKIIRTSFCNTDIYNVYGLTEASPRVAYLPPEYFDIKPESVGVPLQSLDIRIVDKNNNVLPICSVGELVVRGKSIMLGYYNNERTTKSTIIDGWLKTGDLAFIDHDGHLHIKGRIDNLIIRAGMNIYPQEIENTLKLDPRTHEVLVYGVPDEYGTQKIILKISGSFENENEVFDLCISRLPDYERPQTIILMDEIPKNASGKIIRSNNGS